MLNMFDNATRKIVEMMKQHKFVNETCYQEKDKSRTGLIMWHTFGNCKVKSISKESSKVSNMRTEPRVSIV